MHQFEETSSPDSGRCTPTISTSATNHPRVHYRLRGTVDGVERSFALAAEELRIGRFPRSDILLPLPEVSRRHAALRLTAAGLEVEDLGSANGTFVDGRRVVRAGVPAGAELRFGPVQFSVEELAAEDAALSLVLEPVQEAQPALVASPELSEECTVVSAREVPRAAWFEILEGTFDDLAATGRQVADPVRILDFVVAKLGLAGGCAVEWTTAGDPMVLASAGALPRLPSAEEICGRRPPGVPQDQEIWTTFIDRQPPLTLAVDSASRTLRCLLLWGEFVGRYDSAALLRALLRLLHLLRPPGGAPAGRELRERRSALVFPDGYHRCTSLAAVAMYRQLGQVVRSRLPVLVVGETGVGKELVARILHLSGNRRGGPHVAVNCAAIPAEMLEAEMFGIGKGVATGVEARPGQFRLAAGGTLFLDEIGELAPPLQAKLLRALQEREIQPVGGRPQRVDVQVIAATNADLQQRIAQGSFRADLYYRLSGHLVEVPPLRRCREDIPALVEHFLRRFARAAGVRICGVTAKALRHLREYPWPGNLRELEHEIHALVCAAYENQVIDSEMLPHHLRRPPPARASSAGPDAENLALEPRLREVEAQLIREALALTGGNQTEAAKRLEISRNGLLKKMKRLGIASSGPPPDFQRTAERLPPPSAEPPPALREQWLPQHAVHDGGGGET